MKTKSVKEHLLEIEKEGNFNDETKEISERIVEFVGPRLEKLALEISEKFGIPYPFALSGISCHAESMSEEFVVYDGEDNIMLN